MSSLISPFRTLFRFNTRLVEVVLDGLTEEQALLRAREGRGNSVTFLVGHVSSSRYGLMKALQVIEDNPFAGLYGADTGVQDDAPYPPIGEVRQQWATTGKTFDDALAAMTDEVARQSDDHSAPMVEKTLLGLVSFIAWHESYHLGQIGMIVRDLGLPEVRMQLAEAL